MMHFTCDVCGSAMRAKEDPRFVVKIESFAAHEPAALTEEDLEADHVEAIGELLRDLEESAENIELPPARQEFRFDLCPECHRKYVRDPLAKEQGNKLFFSKN
jgi:hypothetical protein